MATGSVLKTHFRAVNEASSPSAPAPSSAPTSTPALFPISALKQVHPSAGLSFTVIRQIVLLFACLRLLWLLLDRLRQPNDTLVPSTLIETRLLEVLDESHQQMMMQFNQQVKALARQRRALPSPALLAAPPAKARPAWPVKAKSPSLATMPPSTRCFKSRTEFLKPNATTAARTAISLANEIGSVPSSPESVPCNDVLIENHTETRELTRDEVVERLADAKLRKYRRVCVPIRGWLSVRQLKEDYNISDGEIIEAAGKLTISVEEVCKGDWRVPSPAVPAAKVAVKGFK